MRPRAHIVVLWVAGAMAAVVAVFFLLRWRNAAAVDTWLGRQVVGIAGSYLEPQIAFESLRYRSPRTVELKAVTLTAPDGTRVTDIGQVTIELTRSPVLGQPLEIRSVVVSGGALHLIETSPGHFKGLRPFLRTRPGEEEDKKVPSEFRLSTVLRLERVEVRDATLRYVPGDGSAPMELGGLSLDLDVTTAGVEDGWHRIQTAFGRYPQCAVTAKGTVNLDTLEAQLEDAELGVDIGPETVGTLPLGLQEIVRRYDAQGRLGITLRGRAPLLDMQRGDLVCTVAVDAFRVAEGDYVFPIDSGRASLSLKNGKASVDQLLIRTLGGEMRVRALAELGRPDRRTDVSWQIVGMDLKALLRGGTVRGRPPKLAGILEGTGQVRTSLDGFREFISGRGRLSVRDGRLLIIPGLSQIAEFFDAALDVTEPRHRADVLFDVIPEGIIITESEVITEFAVATGKGLVGFDERIDLRVHAGPLGKLGSFLGPVGKAVGRFTDRIVTYHVHGRIGDTKVDVLPLGIGR